MEDVRRPKVRLVAHDGELGPDGVHGRGQHHVRRFDDSLPPRHHTGAMAHRRLRVCEVSCYAREVSYVEDPHAGLRPFRSPIKVPSSESPLTSLEPTAGCSRDSRRAPRFVNAVFSPTLLNYGSRPIALPRAHYDTPLFILQFGLCESLPRGPRRIRSVGNGSLRELPREIVLPRSVQRETFAIRVGPPRASGSLLFSPLRLFIGIGQSGGQNGCALCSGSSR